MNKARNLQFGSGEASLNFLSSFHCGLVDKIKDLKCMFFNESSSTSDSGDEGCDDGC